MSFSIADGADTIKYEPYHVKSGVSIAANLRQAFADSMLLGAGHKSVLVMLDTPTMLIPIEEYQQEAVPELYAKAMEVDKGSTVLHSVMPDQNVVAAFRMNKDLKTVIGDNFSDVAIIPMMQPVWNYLYRRSFTGQRRKMYAYLHDRRMELFAFRGNHFSFCNSFDAARASDAAYFILHAWTLMGYKAGEDELHVAGECTDGGKLITLMREYLANVYEINPAADFAGCPATKVSGMPFDLQTFYAKGR